MLPQSKDKEAPVSNTKSQAEQAVNKRIGYKSWATAGQIRAIEAMDDNVYSNFMNAFNTQRKGIKDKKAVKELFSKIFKEQGHKEVPLKKKDKTYQQPLDDARANTEARIAQVSGVYSSTTVSSDSDSPIVMNNNSDVPIIYNSDSDSIYIINSDLEYNPSQDYSNLPEVPLEQRRLMRSRQGPPPLGNKKAMNTWFNIERSRLKRAHLFFEGIETEAYRRAEKLPKTFKDSDEEDIAVEKISQQVMIENYQSGDRLAYEWANRRNKE